MTMTRIVVSPLGWGSESGFQSVATRSVLTLLARRTTGGQIDTLRGFFSQQG
jgi:hypothetical protein